MLKAKVKKLEGQLQSQSQQPALQPLTSAESESEAATSAPQDVDRRVQQELARQHAQRQKALDRLTTERDELRERVQELSKRQDALKSRTQVLEKEKQDAKAKLQLLVDKSRNDDALIDALQRQLETWKGKCHDARRARTADSAAMLPAAGSAATSGSSLSKDERQELERLRSMVNDATRRSVSSGSGMPPPTEAAQYRSAVVCLAISRSCSIYRQGLCWRFVGREGATCRGREGAADATGGQRATAPAASTATAGVSSASAS
ncbi:hypothetical protein PINS_up011322 [Pythium insidiosum]|nr:hypothetical protein PINS_up011322 [Pythium insidiosum]